MSVGWVGGNSQQLIRARGYTVVLRHMTTDLVATFEDSLRGLDVTWDRTTSDGFETTLTEAIEEPAIGAPLPFAELSLEETPVTLEPTATELQEATTGVTAAGAGIAEYGTLMIQSRPGGDEPVSLYAELHVAVLRESDLVAGVPEAISWLGEEFAAGNKSAIFASGASATADMGALIEGVHGPRDVHVIIITDL